MAAAIGSIVLLAVTLVLFMPVRTMRTNMEYARLRRDLSLAVEGMARDIRNHSLDGIDASDRTALVLLPDPDLPGISPNTVAYRAGAGGTLDRYVNGAKLGSLIVSGLNVFSYNVIGDDPAELTNGLTGVTVHLEVQNPDGEITMTRETFIHVRN